MPNPFPSAALPACTATLEESLNLYVDGELRADRHAALFSHLAVCPGCRQTLDAVMRFRRISREEYLALPPAADEVFFERLAVLKGRQDRTDRVADRRPLWQARAPVTLRSAVLAAMLLFVVGVLLPVRTPAQPLEPPVDAKEELVEFIDLDFLPRQITEAVYVFYPGLTIEATPSPEDRLSPESL